MQYYGIGFANIPLEPIIFINSCPEKIQWPPVDFIGNFMLHKTLGAEILI